MSEAPKHASGKTDFELVEAAIDVAVNGADLHEDDEECPQDDTCECRDAATVNDGHRALVRMDRDISSLREQVRALTAERDDVIRRAQEWQQAAEDIRAHAVELERALLIEREDARPLRGEVIILKMERDSLRARVAELETSAERLRETVRTREAAELEALAEADELRARVAEVEKDLTATQAKFNGAAGACLALGTRATKAESERDAAQQRAKALEVCLARELTKEEAP